MVAESVYRVFTFGQEHQHPVVFLLPGIQTPIPLALFDYLVTSATHHFLKFLLYLSRSQGIPITIIALLAHLTPSMKIAYALTHLHRRCEVSQQCNDRYG